VDVLKAGLAARIGLGDVLHVIDVLIAGHGALLTDGGFVMLAAM
jgi:hypothetical protein